MNTRTKKTGSIEYLEATITGDADLSPATVQLAMVAAGATASWLGAAWVGDPTTTGVARTSSTVTYATGRYVVQAKLGASPEAPIVDCYFLHVSP